MHYRAQYSYWRRKIEDEDYFKKKLMLAYLFKDEEIISAVRQDYVAFSLHYHQLHRFLDDRAKLCHLSDTYGHFDYLLSLQSGYRKVHSLIADEESRAVAQSIYWAGQRQVQFSAPSDPRGTTLIVHPNADIATFSMSQLHAFQEIYTFKKESMLEKADWKSEVLSTHVIRYRK